MVYDRLRGIERENLPLSRQQGVDDQETVAQQNVLSSVNGKTPKEHQIGKWFSQERANQLCKCQEPEVSITRKISNCIIYIT